MNLLLAASPDSIKAQLVNQLTRLTGPNARHFLCLLATSRKVSSPVGRKVHLLLAQSQCV